MSEVLCLNTDPQFTAAHSRKRPQQVRAGELGYIVYKEGWYEWDGRGKHEEEAFAGHTLGCIRLMVTDNNLPLPGLGAHRAFHGTSSDQRCHLDCSTGTIGT